MKERRKSDTTAISQRRKSDVKRKHAALQEKEMHPTGERVRF